jgi:hypothetical protein
MNTPAGRERTDRLRAIPLTEVLRAIDATPDPHDPVKWHTPRGVLSVNGTKFFNWNEAAGGGGAIDLAMHLKGLCFKDAIAWLARCFSLRPPPAPIVASQTAQRLVLPVPVANALPIALRYLAEQRRLPLARLRPLVQSGDLYADGKHNAVFILRNERYEPVGAELRGTGDETWRGMAPGSRKENGYFALGPPCPQAIVLCESAIDAISCRTLYPQRLCISTAGARANPAWLPAILARGLTTYCGFDTDDTGERMAQTMIIRYPSVQRLRPSHHDWNDTLHARS